ncbi:MAG: pyridoxal-phosphate dependent enzyme [Planctomycetes bacterium]|nr:pyridoxal-phosphate dependent enzyme [Planctomycetota bacterium]
MVAPRELASLDVATAFTPSGPPRLRARFGDLDLPHVALGAFPTPVEPLEGLSRALGAECWVKRDDRAGARYGGNKVRKLELLLGRALARRRRGVVTIGAYGSHHALATAVYARALGLEVDLVLYPQPITAHVLDDLLADHAVGARLVWTPHAALAPLVAEVVARRAPRTEVVPPGGSSALGTLGYVEGALELADQVRQGLLPAPDCVVVAAGTCGTAAGIALGLELAGLPARVVAVRVVPAAVTNAWLLRRLDLTARRLLRRAGARWSRGPRAPVELDPHELGGGYGVDTPAARAACERFAAEGIALETTYTGKAAAAFLRLAASPALRGRRVLFWHTFSSVDLAPLVAAADPAALPRRFHPALREGARLA